MENIMAKLDEMKGVTYELLGSWLWVSGDTKPYRAELKEMGFWWAPKKCMWYLRPEGSNSRGVRGGTDMDKIRAKYGTATN